MSDTTPAMPVNMTTEHLEYLDDLRESGDTNMFGARPYLLSEFPDLDEKEAGRIVSYWMKTFGNRVKELTDVTDACTTTTA